MAAASYRSSSYRGAVSPRDRIVAWSLAIGAGILLILVLIRMGALGPRLPFDDRRLATFTVLPVAEVETTNRKVAKVSPRPRALTPPPPPARIVPPPPPPPIPLPPNMIVLSRQDYASADIGRMPRNAPAPAQGTAVADAGSNSGAIYGPGDGPGGKRLFAAEWYREPTRAEMVTYLPARQEEGWGMIACRTADRYHVEDCRELGETPGSGIARGLRQAAWQFQVRPPRIDGKPQIGVWVRIKFDLVRGVVN